MGCLPDEWGCVSGTATKLCDHHHCQHALVGCMAEAICICSMNSSSVCLWYGMDVAGQGRADGKGGWSQLRKGLPVDLTEGILKAICMQAQGQVATICDV
ncbi:Os06g0503600 [Oryza sativa Japonica Group]|uniref:Os06g0503600 protein n=1 Tax=Oryza sativa subsp. japonica TaxID=39947 RepID=C7J3T5_ORYSJ|nr:Os06g0503600 [Oryza sativa Japonica Group]|eukprot:NP_001174808.1 Os06g0503600 [Oryza sativa Japonica Group]